MKKSINIYYTTLKFLSSLLFVLFFSKHVFSSEISLEIKGNNFTDEEVILSLLDETPLDLTEDYSNYIIKSLDNSQLFEEVSVIIEENKYIITITEFSNINKIFFENNERLKDEELLKIVDEFDLTNLNPIYINKFTTEIKKMYESFGYNNIDISYSEKINEESNIADIYFVINEGKLTKINKINFIGNDSLDDQALKNSIKSKTKTLLNIFANNNYKNYVVENDVRSLVNLYKDNGFIEIKIDYKVEYLTNNKVNIYFNIIEGDQHIFKSIKLVDQNNFLDNDKKIEIENKIKSSNYLEDSFSIKKVNKLKREISDIIISSGFNFFEVNSLQKIENNNIDIIYEVKSVNPKYVKQINIYGNSRTFDKVIRRELSLNEGDPIYTSQVNQIRDKLRSLNLFNSVEVKEVTVEDNIVDLIINIEERQTGTINAGLSVGTLDGFAVVAGLSERNFYGTGRSLDFSVNTSEDKTQFLLETTDRLSYENDVDITYRANYKEEDFDKSSSYKLNTFSTGAGISYNIINRLRHNLKIDYVIKDYQITNSSTVASAINNSSGENISYVLTNNLFYNTVKSLYLPKDGTIIRFDNSIETPTSSSNGYLKNILTIKNYKKIKKNIFSNQTRVGNIISLNDNDILTDDKFSLGGRWLRGFDTFGAGPRNSRTSYVGGKNLIVTKFDFSRELFSNSDFPVYLNFFNDYGLLWENKTKPTNNDSSIRSSVGLGIRYYSPIGPIGLSWGFPIADEEYDIKRMFLFSIGNID